MTLKIKILVLGISSYVGRHLLDRPGNDIFVGTFCNSPVNGALHFDSLTMDISDLIEDGSSFTHAVILLGDTQPDSCVADIKQSDALNVKSIKRTIDSLISHNIIPVFISSEFVFDGVKGGYVEEDPTNPVLVYGRQKVDVENYLRKNCENYIILRLAKVYGDSLNDNTLFTNWTGLITDERKNIKCAYDQRFSPVFVEDVVDGILRAIEHGCRGTYHLAGPKACTRLEFLEMFLEEMGKYKLLNIKVESCSLLDFDLPEKRPLDVSMKPDKLVNDTGIQLSSPRKVCKRIVKKYLKTIQYTNC